MKKRTSKILNFFAFNLLFFALYLNFIHKDKVDRIDQVIRVKPEGLRGTVLMENPTKYPENESATTNELRSGQDEKVKQDQKLVSVKHTVN